MLAFGTLCQILGNVDFDYQLLGLSMKFWGACPA